MPKNVLNALVEWEDLGTELGIKSSKIREIDRNRKGVVGRCRYDLIDYWLSSDRNASWEKLIEALQSNVMEGKYASVVEAIENTYLPQRPPGN